MLGTPAVTNLYITRLLYTLCGFININDDEKLEVIMGVKYERLLNLYSEPIAHSTLMDGFTLQTIKNINVQNVSKCFRDNILLEYK